MRWRFFTVFGAIFWAQCGSKQASKSLGGDMYWNNSLSLYSSRFKFNCFIICAIKEFQIVYRLFLVNCYLLHVPRLPSQPASNVGGWVIELAWQYIAMTRNNLSIIWISLGRPFAFISLHRFTSKWSICWGIADFKVAVASPSPSPRRRRRCCVVPHIT